jgi:hypothetical protein
MEAFALETVASRPATRMATAPSGPRKSRATSTIAVSPNPARRALPNALVATKMVAT